MNPKPITVLLIDDESEFTSTLAERLDLRGYVTHTAPDGEAGIQTVMDREVDIVVLDLMMPGLSGLETLKQIKRIQPDLPVILLTGHGSTKEGMEGMRLGALDYLIKPLDINDLLKKITQATQPPQGQQP
ncbi:response regulator [Desulfatiferula olefinivorans]